MTFQCLDVNEKYIYIYLYLFCRPDENTTVNGMSASGSTTVTLELSETENEEQTEDWSDYGIKDVWAYNLEEEFASIRKLLPKYCYVAMDTEFPGVVARPIGEFKNPADYLYQLLRCNVDLLRIIQIGLSFFDEDGKTPADTYSTWQFNFKFNLSEDMYAQDSIELLTNSRYDFFQFFFPSMLCVGNLHVCYISGFVINRVS